MRCEGEEGGKVKWDEEEDEEEEACCEEDGGGQCSYAGPAEEEVVSR